MYCLIIGIHISGAYKHQSMATSHENLLETHIVGSDTQQVILRAEDHERSRKGKFPMWALAMPQCRIGLCGRT